MLREERLQFILKKLEKQQRVFSVELSEELQVSDDTIRRDLNELAEAGKLKKVHGGAVPVIPKAPAPLKLTERISYAQAEKEIIMHKALALFKDGQTVILDNGSTNMLIASNLPQSLNATIFTNSLPIAQILCAYPNIELVFVGGKIFKNAQVAEGAATVQALSKIRADFCIVGVCSIHPTIGVTTPYWEEGLVKQKMVEVSERVIATAWRDKFNTAETCWVCDYETLDLLITDSSLSPSQRADYEGKGVEIW
ncbi:MAG: DeoR/GlpR family DNA-binding transcription regulator [Spirosomataceae bacterium]